MARVNLPGSSNSQNEAKSTQKGLAAPECPTSNCRVMAPRQASTGCSSPSCVCQESAVHLYVSPHHASHTHVSFSSPYNPLTLSTMSSSPLGLRSILGTLRSQETLSRQDKWQPTQFLSFWKVILLQFNFFEKKKKGVLENFTDCLWKE